MNAHDWQPVYPYDANGTVQCARCGYGDDGQHRHNPPPSVPTISYLNEGEWE